MSFSGQRLKEARTKKGMSQEALARAAGTTTSTITRMEREVHQPYANTVDKIAQALGINHDDLYVADTEAVA